jgi:hypothetical protein
MVGYAMTDWKAADRAWQRTKPETQDERTERLRRLEAYEMKTRVIESQVDLLLGVIEAYREGWKQ